MSFRVQGLAPQEFMHLYGLSDDELAQIGAQRFIVNDKPGFPRPRRGKGPRHR